MSEPANAHVSAGMEDVKVRSVLTFGTIGVFAAIIFGLLYLFVLAPAAPGSSAGWFLFAFATGITMIVMPCTLPLAFVIVPLSMGKGIAKGLGISLAFGIGIAVTQSMYGVVAAIIGNLALGALGAPLEDVKNWVYLVAGIFALLFALGEIGLIKVRMPTYAGAAPAFIQRRQDVVKAFLLGLFLGNIGIGCPHPATPLLLIEAASSGNVIYGWLLFLTHAFGRILPLLLLAFLGILGVNGLSWLMSRKESVERATGWAMVFVAGFILTLGLFTHDWWVNSGIHSGLEKVTNESFFNQWFNQTLNTTVAHAHGLEVGSALIGLPLWMGNWFLVAVWVIPMWWWWARKRRALLGSPAFRLKEIELRMDRLEKSRRELEEVVKLDDAETDFDLAAHRTQMDELEKVRRAAEEKVQFAEKGLLKEPVARSYEAKILSMQRNYLVVLTGFLALIFIYFLPTNFYLNSLTGGHGVMTMTMTTTPTGPVGKDGMPLAPLNRSTAGLPEAVKSEVVTLQDGDAYEMSAGYVKKTVGGRSLRLLAYNGSIPGPFITAPVGSTITINFKNNTDMDQTIHSHGVRLDNRFDGTPGVTQGVVKPGETFAYQIRFDDVGVQWYHPHTRDDIGQELGLYGNYIVEPLEEDYWNPVNREVPLVIDDILIVDGDTAPFYKETVTHALLGRFGKTYLVNGEEQYALPVRPGEVIRFLVTNVSNTRTYNLMIPGARLKVVGADIGRYEREFESQTLLLAPAERLVVEAYFEKSGTYRLTNTTPLGSTILASFVVAGEKVATSYLDAFENKRVNQDVIDEFASFRAMATSAPDKRLKLSVRLTTPIDHSAHMHGGATSGSSSGMMMMPDGTMMDASSMGGMGNMGGMMGTGMDGIQWDDPKNTDIVNTSDNVTWLIVDEATGKENMDIPVSDWTWKQGSLVKMRITNDTKAPHVMQHPIHLHGQRFVELARNGVVNKNMAWKDTTLTLPGETLDILVDMSNPGNWMLHCHIVEHLHAGMMMTFRVEDAAGTAPGDDYRATQAVNMGTAASSSFRYAQVPNTNGYAVASDKTRFSVNRLQYFSLSFTDPNKMPVNLSGTAQNPLRVTFVSSDDKNVVVTYPGKNDFVVTTSSAGHVDAPGTPPHTHSLLPLVNVAYADGGAGGTAGHVMTPGMAMNPRTYTVPVVLPTLGSYRAFVEYIPENEVTPRIATFDVTVVQGGFNIDAMGLSPRARWWVLLLISFGLMVPLVMGVRRYISAPLK